MGPGLRVGESLESQTPKVDRSGGSRTRQPGDLWARQVAIDLAGDVALQDADDLMLGLPFFEARDAEVDLGLGVVGEALSEPS